MPRDPSTLARLKIFERGKVWGPTERALDAGFFYPPLIDPKVVSATEADFMRDDDQVLGVCVKDLARAYPVWLVDYYHTVNDALAGDHVLVAHCDRCMSGSAFLARVDSQRLIFRSFGIHNAALVIQDLSSKSIWLHYEGIALDGAKAGAMLEQIPAFHMTWEEWKELHADTDVVIPSDPRHRDPRHGHARTEWLGRAHMNQKFWETVVGEPDLRLPENELCLFASAGGAVRSYPVREIKKEGGVVHDMLSRRDIVVLAGPASDSFAMAAFSRRLGAEVLTFRNDGKYFRDLETDSPWTIDGRCVDGKMKGERLKPLDFYFLRWSAWAWSHPNTGIWTSTCRDVKGLAPEELKPVVSGIANHGFRVHVRDEVLNLLRPLAAERGISLTVDGEGMGLYQFATVLSARDFEYLGGHCLRKGRFVIRLEPELFTDNSHLTRLPDDNISWARLLSDRRFMDAFYGALSNERDEPEGVGFKEIYEGLRARGHRIEDIPSPIEGGGRTVERFITRSQLRVKSLTGVVLGIDGDPFIVYMFNDEDSAREYCLGEPHAFFVDRLVFRSTPSDMYTPFEVYDKPDSKVSWSKLLNDESFHRELREIIALSPATT